MLSAKDKQDILECAIVIWLLVLWYILEWYKEKSGQGRRR